jgi:hypothetical protein
MIGPSDSVLPLFSLPRVLKIRACAAAPAAWRNSLPDLSRSLAYGAALRVNRRTRRAQRGVSGRYSNGRLALSRRSVLTGAAASLRLPLQMVCGGSGFRGSAAAPRRCNSEDAQSSCCLNQVTSAWIRPAGKALIDHEQAEQCRGLATVPAAGRREAQKGPWTDRARQRRAQA